MLTSVLKEFQKFWVTALRRLQNLMKPVWDRQVLHAVAKHNGLTQDEQRWAGRVFEATTIKQGSIALPPEDLGKKMDRKTYRSYIHDNLLSLSLEACRKSLADWGRFERKQISLEPGLGLDITDSFPKWQETENCPASAGGSIDEITHLVWATMSAVIDAPSVSLLQLHS